MKKTQEKEGKKTLTRAEKKDAAKNLIKERKYNEAVKILLEIEQKKGEFEYNAYLMFGVYTDLDNCYRHLFDFENAYRYASKRISLLEGFKS